MTEAAYERHVRAETASREMESGGRATVQCFQHALIESG
jgi:hypothetical protein